MKAKDYYEQFGAALLAESYHEEKFDELNKLVMAFVREEKEIIESRKMCTDRGAVAVIKEQNEKWNALVAIFEKKHGVSPIVRNGFMILMKSKIPELERWSR